MTEWIPATRETAGYYADDPPQRPPYPPTCRERQDAAIEDLQVAAGYVQAATERLTRELAELRARVDALQADVWEMPPDAVSYAILEPVRDDALDDDDEPRTATPNQTYSWLPGDAWSQYCAEVDASEGVTP